MAVNKVIYDSSTLIDLTQDTVTPETLLVGTVAHDASGSQITGEYIPALREPIAYDFETGYTNLGEWIWQDSVNNHTDIYEVETNHIYMLCLDDTVGTRFRSGYATTNPLDISSGKISGTQVVNLNNPNPYQYVAFKSALDGYLYVTKDNVGTSGLKSYLYDVTPT